MSATVEQVREIVREAVEMHRSLGLKAAWAAVGDIFGMAPRRVRMWWAGEVRHVSADEYQRALEARALLVRQRAAKLRLELARLEAIEQGAGNAMDQDARGGNADKDGGHPHTHGRKTMDAPAPVDGRDRRCAGHARRRAAAMAQD